MPWFIFGEQLLDIKNSRKHEFKNNKTLEAIKNDKYSIRPSAIHSSNEDSDENII